MVAFDRPMRLPSFNDVSPVIMQHDIRLPLQIVARHEGDREGAIAEFANLFFGGKANGRSRVNVPATLTSTGLLEGATFSLTAFGRRVLAARSAEEAAKEFARV